MTSLLCRLSAVFLLLHLAACTTLRPVQIPRPDDAYLAQPVRVGSEVEVVERDGDRHAFTVTRVDADGIWGEDIFYPYLEMTSLKVRVTDDRGIEWIGGALLVIALIWLAAESDSACLNCNIDSNP